MRYTQLLFYRLLKLARLMVKKSFIIISRSLTVSVACLKKILLFVYGTIYLNDISEQAANLCVLVGTNSPLHGKDIIVRLYVSQQASLDGKTDLRRKVFIVRLANHLQRYQRDR